MCALQTIDAARPTAVQQRAAALEKAKSARRERADLRLTVQSANSPHALLAQLIDPDAGPITGTLGRIALADILKWLPNVGAGRARKIARQAGVADDQRAVGRLTERQRILLAFLITDGKR